MAQTFSEQPILALFLVIAIGYGLGRLKIGNFKMGIAAVLFVGLAFGAIFPNASVPTIMVYFGLSLFVYNIGLASGPSFFSAVQKNGIRDVGFVITMLALTASITAGLHFLFGFDVQTTAGLYAGSTTNTPALAGLIDLIAQTNADATTSALLAQDAVAGYSLAYPMGIVGTLIAFTLVQRWLKIDYQQEIRDLKDDYPVDREIFNRFVEIQNAEVTGIQLRDLKPAKGLSVIFGRRVRDGETVLTNWDTTFAIGDRAVIVGDEASVEHAIAVLGSAADEISAADSDEYERKRIFISNAEIAGHSLSSLNINEKFSAIVTRVRRGDMDILANQDTIVELGDIVYFITRKRDSEALSNLFGDSYETVSRVNLFSLGLGLVMGLFLGLLSFTLFGGITFKLGFAVGPIVMGLVLGSLRRTGPIVWSLPFSANVTFQQLGLAILLGGIAINSGATFIQTIVQATGLLVLLASAVIAFVSSAITLIVGYKIVKLPFSLLGGMVAHQPAILDFALTQSNNKLPNLGFTLMLPIAIILKIVFVQLLYVVLS